MADERLDRVSAASIFRCSAAGAAVVRAATFTGSAANVADFSRAMSFGGTVRNRAEVGLDGRRLDAGVGGKMAADVRDSVGPSDDPLDRTGATDGLVFGWRAAPPLDNDAV
jgi:hypothetical protein